jgi:DNA end-binding protein Ku
VFRSTKMARSIWNGVVSFGMVSIPVSLKPATQAKDLAFHMIHEICGSRIKLQKFCPVCDRVVTQDELVRGYSISKTKHVVLKPDDFEGLPVPSLHAIEVVAFVQATEIDPVYFDKSYHVEPEKTGMKPYALLVQALDKKGMSALAKVAFRDKEHLCLLRETEGRIVMETLFYPDEIRQPESAQADDVSVGKRELDMALSLVELLSDKFDPAQYEDEYRKALLARIEHRVEGGAVEETAEGAKPEVIDLMEALKASLDAAKKGKRKSG